MKNSFSDTNNFSGAKRTAPVYRGSYTCIFVCLLLFLSCNALAQLKFSLKRYSTEDGLSHDGILCITKDKEGFMWFGTWDGINRFDGHVFTTYKARPGDNSKLKNNKIRNIVEDRAGYLWIKTYDNLVYRFDKRKEEFLSVPGPQKEYQGIEADRIIPVSSGDTWLLTTGNGLLCAVTNPKSAVPEIYRYSKKMKGNFYLPSDTVRFLFEDHEKKTWIGTTRGLVCLVKKNGKYYRAALNAKGNVFGLQYSFTCAARQQNTIYFGTSNGTLISFANNQFKEVPIAAGTRLNAVCPSKSGKIYISTTGKGLITFDQQSSRISYANMPGNSAFYSLYEDKAGRIWIEPEKSGVIKYDPRNAAFRHYNQKKDANVSSPNKNYGVFEDVNGVLWASFKGGGFGYFNPVTDNIEYFYNEPGSRDQQFSNIVTALYADRTGTLWFSANNGGINKVIFLKNNFKHQLLSGSAQNRSENEVRALYEDSMGRLWVGSKAGRLYIFKGGREIGNVFVNAPNMDIGNVYAITEDREGTMWLGTKGKGLIMARPTNKERSKYKISVFLTDPRDKYSLSSNMVYSVIQDRKGRVWAGTLGGGLNMVDQQDGKLIFRNNKNSFRNYPPNSNVIRHLREDATGKIWIASTDGLVIFDPDKGKPDTYIFSKYSKIPGDSTSLGNNDVQFIHKDRLGQMWVATFGGGLNKAIAGPGQIKFRIYTREEGLPNDIVLSMADDSNGNLWLATGNGLSEYIASTQTFKNYDSYNGLPETGFSEAACFRSRTGEMYFGCIKGFICFDPKNIYDIKLDAGMALTNLQLYNKDVVAGTKGSPLTYALNNTSEIRLDYDQDVLSIDYSVLDYRASHKINYAYMLKGYDKTWHYVKNQRKATYTNLPPGHYTFTVKSTSTDLFKNIPSKSIKITVMPPPWLTVWAYIVYFIIVVILLEIARRIIVTMIRLRNKIAVEQRLTDLKLQFFTNISHELRTPLTLIVSPLEELARTEEISARGRENIGIVNRNANRMIRFINQLLDFRKIQSGKMRLKVNEVEIVRLIRDISMYFAGRAHEKNIDLQIHSDTDELYAWIDEEKIDIVIYNLLSNAFKFSPPDSNISIDISSFAEEGYFTIAITDQGNGIPKNKLNEIFEIYYEGDKTSENNLKGTGIGLALSKELIEAHHGEISAANNVAGGMKFTLRLKLGKAHFDSSKVDYISSSNLAGFIDSGYIEHSPYDSRSAIAGKHTGHSEGSVLLIEDNVELRRFLSDQLADHYKVEEASDGAEGYEKAMSLLPDLIISDVMMPNMDGIQMLDRLKNNEITSHIPVILLTAKSSVESQIEGLRYGADFYITKPFHTDHILASISNLLKKRKSLYDLLTGNEKKLVKLKPDEILITSKDEQFLKEMIRIVEEGMEDSKFNIESAAGSVGMGRTTFYKKLKSLTGLAPVEFVRDIRLKRAEQLLGTGEYTISEIAYMTGFSSSGYFSTCFKDKYKLSPSDYSKRNKADDVHLHNDQHN